MGKNRAPFRRSPQYFSLKGRQAEQLIQELAEKTFLTDWCYANPRLPDGKELCDLLIIFDTTSVIWQIKNLDSDKHGVLKSSELEKNLRQLGGARRQLFDLKTKIELTNPRRGKETLDVSAIKQVHLISAIFGPPGHVLQEPMRFLELAKGHTCHVFALGFTEIILNELDTVSDFCGYLRCVELAALDTRMIVDGGQEELLAHYLSKGQNLEWLSTDKVNVVHSGAWMQLNENAAYRLYKVENEVSYFWDQLIDMAHEGAAEETQYERVARELARSNRFERRLLAKTFIDGHGRAHREIRNNVYRRVFDFQGLTYCFLYMHNPIAREVRKNLLKNVCFVARGKVQGNSKVVGIATEMKLDFAHSFDFGLMQKDDWTADDQKRMEEIQSKFGILTNPQMVDFDEEAYRTNLRFHQTKQNS